MGLSPATIGRSLQVVLNSSSQASLWRLHDERVRQHIIAPSLVSIPHMSDK